MGREEELVGIDDLLGDRVGRPLERNRGSSGLFFVLHLNVVVGVGREGNGGTVLIRGFVPRVDDKDVIDVEANTVVAGGVEGVVLGGEGLHLTPPAGGDVVATVGRDGPGSPVEVDGGVGALNDGGVEQPLVVVVLGVKASGLQLNDCERVVTNRLDGVSRGVGWKAGNLLLDDDQGSRSS